MRRGPLIAAVAVVVLTALLAVVTNWAIEIIAVPVSLADARVIVLVGVVLVLLLAVTALVGGRAPDTPHTTPAEFPTFATVAPSLRPPPPGPVFGRDAELAALAAAHRELMLDVLCAGGGTGKTTLAREVARRRRAARVLDRLAQRPGRARDVDG